MVNLQSGIDTIRPGLIELRHDLHAHPETAYAEVRTAARILELLQDIAGLKIRSGVAGTGIVATLNPDRDGPCVALRAELDALPVQEQSGLPYASQNAGCMHACGHDGHMTCVVGAAMLLATMADELPGKVKFIFQPAEEHGAGAARMIDDGALDDPKVDAAFALHGWPALPLGTVAIGAGAVMAGAHAFEITIRGRGGHAGYPHAGIDPVVAAAHLTTAIQTIVSRTVDPVDAAVVSVCHVQAGTTHNVIPDHCRMVGTVRALRQATGQQAWEQLRHMVETVPRAFGACGEIEVLERYPVLMNDVTCARLVRDVGRTLLSDRQVIDTPAPSLGAEDFAFIAGRVPAAMFRLGVQPAEGGEVPSLHHPRYDFNDDAIAVGVAMHCGIVLQMLNDPPRFPCG